MLANYFIVKITIHQQQISTNLTCFFTCYLPSCFLRKATYYRTSFFYYSNFVICNLFYSISQYFHVI